MTGAFVGGSSALTAKVALVTGGGSGIGLGMARALAQAGATVVIAGRDAARGRHALGALPPSASFLPLDVGEEESCRTAMETILDRHGGIDILFNNAGISIGKAPQDVTLDEWHRTLDVNLTGAFMLCQSCFPHMAARGGGKIVNVGSIVTLFGSAFAAPYGASKGGIGQLTKALAVAWAGQNIQVNAILPGYVATDLVEEAMVRRPDLHDTVLARTPAGRLGRPEDFGGVAVFLASSASDFVTGALIPVDGGYMSQG